MVQEFERKIFNLLEKIDSKLDRLLETEVNSELSSEGVQKPSEIAEREEKKQDKEGTIKVEGRRVCPKCGETTFKEVDDKSEVLHQQGGLKIYAKKYICQNCGTAVK